MSQPAAPRVGVARWQHAWLSSVRMPDIAIHVRRAVLADADALGDVHVRVWRWAYRSLMPDDFLHRLRADRRADH